MLMAFLKGSMKWNVHVVAYVARLTTNYLECQRVPLLTVTRISMCNNDTMTKKGMK